MRERVVVAAALGGVATTAVAVNAMRWLHVGCDWAVGGEAGSGVWLCPDGIAYAVPTIACGALGSGLVLLAAAVVRRRQ